MRLGFLRTVGRWRRICYSRGKLVVTDNEILRQINSRTLLGECPKRGMDAAHHRHSLSSRTSWHVFKDISLLLSALLFSCQGTEQELKRRNVSG